MKFVLPLLCVNSHSRFFVKGCVNKLWVIAHKASFRCWKRFEGSAKRQKKLLRLANQAESRSFECGKKCKFGVEVPGDHDDAVHLDKGNGNDLWREVEGCELGQTDKCDMFCNPDEGNLKPTGHEKTRVHVVHVVHNVKHEGCRKARLVADGHPTDVPTNSAHSSMVSLQGLRLVVFLAKLNGPQAWKADIGNACLEAHTKEKLCVVGGDEFADCQGHTLIIDRASCDLKSSGLRWHGRFSKVLRSMGFVPSQAENDVWMKDCGDHCKCIAHHVDDPAIASCNPKAITDALVNEHNFKLKVTGPLECHLGCGHSWDEDGTLCASAARCINKVLDDCFCVFGEKPKQAFGSPLEHGDHPELDDMLELGIDGIKQCQSLIGTLQ